MDVSDSFTFPPSNFIKKEILAKMIFCEFCKISKKIFDRARPDDYFLSLSVKRLISNEVGKSQPESLRKKLFHISSFMYFAFIF